MSFRSSGKQTPKALLGGILWKMRKEGGEEELGFGGALGGRPCAVLHWASRSGSRTLHAWPLAGSTTSVRVGHAGSRRGGRRGSASRPLESWAPGYEPSAQERQEAYFFRPLTRGCQQGCHLVTCGPRFLTWQPPRWTQAPRCLFSFSSTRSAPVSVASLGLGVCLGSQRNVE